MNLSALLYALNALEAIPQLIAAGANVVQLATDTADAVKRMQAERRDPTADEWAAQAATIATLRARLHA